MWDTYCFASASGDPDLVLPAHPVDARVLRNLAQEPQAVVRRHSCLRARAVLSARGRSEHHRVEANELGGDALQRACTEKVDGKDWLAGEVRGGRLGCEGVWGWASGGWG